MIMVIIKYLGKKSKKKKKYNDKSKIRENQKIDEIKIKGCL